MADIKLTLKEAELVLSKLYGTNREHPEVALKIKIETYIKTQKSTKPKYIAKKVTHKPGYLQWSTGIIELKKKFREDTWQIHYRKRFAGEIFKIVNRQFIKDLSYNAPSPIVQANINRWLVRYDRFIAMNNLVG